MTTRTPLIVSLLPSATEIVCALGLADSLVGVTHECDYPRGVNRKPQLTASRISHQAMSSAEIDHAVRSQLDGHGCIYDLDEVRLRSLAPDLILTQELCDVCAVSYRTVEQAARLLDADVTVVSLEPTTIADILANIVTVGELTDRNAQADTLVSGLRARLDALAASVSGVTRRPRTLVLEWLEPPFAPGHWVPEQVSVAGGDPTFGTAGGVSRTTTAEEISGYAPETIVLAPCGFSTADTLHALPRARLPACWPELPAVRNGNVWALDATSYFSRPGPRVIDGAEILARILHPDVVGLPEERHALRVPPELMHV
ncbi:MAG: cobalamin-binding protein [Pseudonocardiales bacterium]|nr:cobalamin-binding protein [Pseudonocardiales bacterium]MBV9728553.1 cobalamin-binding protein [Pseudonocardiales bacterium]